MTVRVVRSTAVLSLLKRTVNHHYLTVLSVTTRLLRTGKVIPYTFFLPFFFKPFSNPFTFTLNALFDPRNSVCNIFYSRYMDSDSSDDRTALSPLGAARVNNSMSECSDKEGTPGTLRQPSQRSYTK